MSTNLTTELRRQPSEAQLEKSDREREREIKTTTTNKQRRQIPLEEQNEIFFSGGEKIRNASGQQVEDERRREKANRNTSNKIICEHIRHKTFN